MTDNQPVIPLEFIEWEEAESLKEFSKWEFMDARDKKLWLKAASHIAFAVYRRLTSQYNDEITILKQSYDTMRAEADRWRGKCEEAEKEAGEYRKLMQRMYNRVWDISDSLHDEVIGLLRSYPQPSKPTDNG